MDKINEDYFNESLKRMSSPEIKGVISTIDSIIGFKLNSLDKQPFLYFHDYLTNPQPDFIEEWRNNKNKEKWYHRLSNGILGDVQNSYACILYHYDNLIRLESLVIESIEKFEYRKVLGNSVLSPGDTLIWDFEYQAFILAYRRFLDYLTRAICSYFMNDYHSYTKLASYLEKLNRPIVSKPLITIHKKYSSHFDFVTSDGERKSLRDKISHYEYVPVGCINLSRKGFILAGGGEKLGLLNDYEYQNLSEILQHRIMILRQFTRELIFSFVDSIRKEQNELKNKK